MRQPRTLQGERAAQTGCGGVPSVRRMTTARTGSRVARILRNVALTGDGDANLVGNAHDNVLTGNAGANRLEGGGGNDTLDGGDGVDTAVFSGPAADYEVATGEDGVTVSDSQTDRDGVDTLRGVESLQFSDETVELE